MANEYRKRFLAVHCRILPPIDDSRTSFRDVSRKRKPRPGGLECLQLYATRSHSVSSRDRLAEPIEAKHGETAAVRGRAECADRFLTCVHLSAGLRREALESYADHASSSGPAMLDARNHLLADEAALGKVDAAQLVHVALVRKCIAIDEIKPAARDRERNAMRLVGHRIDELGANPGCRLVRPMRRKHAAPPQLGETWIRVAQAIFGIGRSLPDRHDPEHLREILNDHFCAQLVKIESFDQRWRERSRSVKKKAATVGRFGFRNDEVRDDLSLRRQQGSESSMPGIDLSGVARDQPIEKFARVIARDLDDAALGKQRCLHDRNLPERSGSTQGGYCLVRNIENSPLRMRSARPSAKRAAGSSP